MHAYIDYGKEETALYLNYKGHTNRLKCQLFVTDVFGLVVHTGHRVPNEIMVIYT